MGCISLDDRSDFVGQREIFRRDLRADFRSGRAALTPQNLLGAGRTIRYGQYWPGYENTRRAIPPCQYCERTFVLRLYCERTFVFRLYCVAPYRNVNRGVPCGIKQRPPRVWYKVSGFDGGMCLISPRSGQMVKPGVEAPDRHLAVHYRLVTAAG
eukprot:1810201-Rhodomonas_salina.4